MAEEKESTTVVNINTGIDDGNVEVPKIAAISSADLQNKIIDRALDNMFKFTDPEKLQTFLWGYNKQGNPRSALDAKIIKEELSSYGGKKNKSSKYGLIFDTCDTKKHKKKKNKKKHMKKKYRKIFDF